MTTNANLDGYQPVRYKSPVETYLTSELNIEQDYTTVSLPVKLLDKIYIYILDSIEDMQINKRFKTLCQQSVDPSTSQLFSNTFEQHETTLDSFAALHQYFNENPTIDNAADLPENMRNHYITAIHSIILTKLKFMTYLKQISIKATINITYINYIRLKDFIEEFFAKKSPDGYYVLSLTPIGKLLISLLLDFRDPIKTFGKESY